MSFKGQPRHAAADAMIPPSTQSTLGAPVVNAELWGPARAMCSLDHTGQWQGCGRLPLACRWIDSKATGSPIITNENILLCWLALASHGCKLRLAMFESAFDPLRRLFRRISARRRRQLVLLSLFMLVGASAESISLGAVLPLLALLTDPGRISDYPWVDQQLTAFGIVQPSQRLLAMALTFSLVVVVSSAIRVGLAWFSNKLVFLLGHDLTIEVYNRIIHQPYRFFVARNSSETIAAFGKVQLITGRVLLAAMNLVTALTLSAFILIALLLIDARTALVAGVGVAGIYIAVSHGVRRRLRANSVIAAGAEGKRVQCFQEAVGSIRNVLLDDTQQLYIEKLRRVDRPLRNAEAASGLIAVAPRYLVEGASMILIVLIAYSLTSEPGTVSTALPTLGALALGAQRLLPLLQQIYLGWAAATSNWAVLTDVLDLVELPIPDEYSTPAPKWPIPFDHSISLRNVNFRYAPDDPLVLRNVNLTVAKGTRCGVIGKSGSGKSTLIDIVMGLLQPTSGELLVDQELITAGNRRAWQARIAHVPQLIYLADASVAENIALGVEKEKIDMDRVREVARKAQVAEFVETHPALYNAVVGERGVRLSGGQRQRIAIARALYKRADVLILDEATSALDDETEKAVVDCIDNLGDDLTIFVIAHRLSTLRNCDQVVRLDVGSVIDRGRYEDVIAQLGSARHDAVGVERMGSDLESNAG